MIKAGTAITMIPGSPHSSVAPDMRHGPAVKPRFPPTEKMLMPRPLCVVDTLLAILPACGWNIATPMPEVVSRMNRSEKSVIRPMNIRPRAATMIPRLMR